MEEGHWILFPPPLSSSRWIRLLRLSRKCTGMRRLTSTPSPGLFHAPGCALAAHWHRSVHSVPLPALRQLQIRGLADHDGVRHCALCLVFRALFARKSPLPPPSAWSLDHFFVLSDHFMVDGGTTMGATSCAYTSLVPFCPVQAPQPHSLRGSPLH